MRPSHGRAIPQRLHAATKFAYHHARGAAVKAMAKYARSRATRKHGGGFKKRYTPKTVLGKRKIASSAGGVSKRRKVYSSKRIKPYSKRGGKRRGGSFSNAIAKVDSSAFSLGPGPRLFSGFRRTQQPTTVNCTISSRVSSTPSQQAVQLLPTYFFAGDGSAGDPSRQSAFTIDSYILNRAERWLANFQNSVPTQTPGGTNQGRDGMRNTQKFVVNKIHYDQQIRNMSNQDVDVILYDVVMRNNVQPNLTRATGTNLPVADPLKDWESGLLIEQIQGGLYLGTRLGAIGTTPFMSTAFCKLYRIAKVTKKTLSSGAVHHHHITVKPRQMFDTQVKRYADETAPDLDTTGLIGVSSRGPYLPGMSGFTILVASGSIGNNNVEKAQIGYTSTALDVVTKGSFSFSNFTRERRFHLNFDGLATNVNQIVTDDTDLIGPVQEA
ncbi:putative capsid protein [Bromus-associated circular DNA virus 4]|uniref:Putative capsid protein n=1 Tax=Bromus-associated circular DNA virus 4 TaxID=1590172 RepID=A0A0B4U9L1_9VIRU|nr:putative capsid protein [Bromus-associated circular DNA virus 4]AJC52533.1 putative capsid protein [Bromus-associated circular DNA virus 4]